MSAEIQQQCQSTTIHKIDTVKWGSKWKPNVHATTRRWRCLLVFWKTPILDNVTSSVRMKMTWKLTDRRELCLSAQKTHLQKFRKPYSHAASQLSADLSLDLFFFRERNRFLYIWWWTCSCQNLDWPLKLFSCLSNSFALPLQLLYLTRTLPWCFGLCNSYPTTSSQLSLFLHAVAIVISSRDCRLLKELCAHLCTQWQKLCGPSTKNSVAWHVSSELVCLPRE